MSGVALMSAQSSLLADIRAGLHNPFAPTVALGATVITRAEARAIERALSAKGGR